MPIWNGVLTRRRMVLRLALGGIASVLGHGVAFARQARALLTRIVSMLTRLSAAMQAAASRSGR